METLVQPHKDVPLLVWIISGKNAMQMFLMLIAVLSGIPILLGSAPTSTESAVPDWAIRIWGSALVLGGTFNLVGTYWRGPNHERGMQIEQWSANILGIAATMYPTVLLLTARDRGSAAYLIVITYGFAMACLGRVLQIRRDRRQYRFLRDAIAGVEDK